MLIVAPRGVSGAGKGILDGIPVELSSSRRSVGDVCTNRDPYLYVYISTTSRDCLRLHEFSVHPMKGMDAFFLFYAEASPRITS